jgi:hypothetical protein
MQKPFKFLKLGPIEFRKEETESREEEMES